MGFLRRWEVVEGVIISFGGLDEVGLGGGDWEEVRAWSCIHSGMLIVFVEEFEKAVERMRRWRRGVIAVGR